MTNTMHATDCPDELDMSPGSSSWREYATASKVAAMIGMSTHDSEKSMWLKMRHPDRFPRTSNKVQSRGHYLEAGFLQKWYDEHPEWEPLSLTEVLMTRPDLGYKAAATPDSVARHRETGEVIVIDNKTTGQWADHFAWGDPGTDVIPYDYFAQGAWQLIIARYTYPDIKRAAFIKSGPMLDDQETYWITYDEALFADIEFRVAAFMRSLILDVEPVNDTRAETFDAIRKVHSDILRGVDGEQWEINIDLAIEYTESIIDAERADGRLNKAKSDVFRVMGKARQAIIPTEPVIGKSGKPLKAKPLVVASRVGTAGGGTTLKKPTKPHDVLEQLRVLRRERLAAERITELGLHDNPLTDALKAAATATTERNAA